MMKKTIIAILALTLGLALITIQAVAGPAAVTVAAPKTPGPHNTPGPHGTPGAQATEHAGQHGKHQNFRGTIAAVDSSSLTLTLRDGSSVSLILTADTRIKIPGKPGSGTTLQVGMQAMAQAIADQNGNLTARAVMAIPGKPIRVHRVGTITAYSAGSSITITASDGNSYTFTLTGDTKILPTERAGELAVGSRVTIVAPRDPSSLGSTASGIVVHPAGSG